MQRNFINGLQEEYREKEKELEARYSDLFETERQKFVNNFMRHMENLIIDEKEQSIAMINAKYREKEMILRDAASMANREFKGVLHKHGKREKDKEEVKHSEPEGHFDGEMEDIMHEEKILREKLERLMHKEKNL